MNFTPELLQRYTTERLSAREAQRLAEFIAFGPVVFQVARLMKKWGLLEQLRQKPEGMTLDELLQATGRTDYAVKVLLESSLTMGTLLVDPETMRYRLSKAGWFLLTDTLTDINMAFNHDINYKGLFDLEEALEEGRPAGLKHFGSWPTIYEGLSSLPSDVQESWFRFDHFYSDTAFDEALKVVFAQPVAHLLDVGGNTGRWALRCVDHDEQVRVTIMDLPQQVGLMKDFTAGKPGADRIDGCGANLLDADTPWPRTHTFDAVWMSQFLDCFSMAQITGILTRAAEIMAPHTRLYIMETLWDRQRFETATFCLTQISLYFSALANGNSKMYHTDDLLTCIDRAGLVVETIHDNLGHGHSLVVCRRK